MAQRTQFTESWVGVAGIRTRYIAEGAGEPLLFIHGGHFGDMNSAECAEVWNLTIPDLASHWRCVALDRLGQGFTEGPKDEAAFTMAASVRHVADFVRAIDIAPCHVVGHSRGGYVAARLALDHPALVRSCTIVSSNTIAPGPASNEIVFADNPHRPFSAERARFVVERYSYSIAHIDEAWLAIRARALQSQTYRAAAQRMAERALYLTQFSPQLEDDRHDLLDRIARDGLRQPTLVVWSGNDATAPVAVGLDLFRRLAARQQRTEFHLLNATGHYCYRERAPEFNRTLRDFLGRV
ncbi:MAG TPA: alpha/beta fold hydrolase [Candidatus Binataceae bacterium]|nr:alpha/beta fold hydrolase [Candidatus Binataceae bacterium]